MSRNDNYPDDIRMYDDDPRSPFYVDPDDEWLESEQTLLAEDWAEELDKTGRVDLLDWDQADFEVARGDQSLAVFIQVKAADYVADHKDDFRPIGPEWD